MNTSLEARARSALGLGRRLWCVALTASLAVACTDSQGIPASAVDGGTVPTVWDGGAIPTDGKVSKDAEEARRGDVLATDSVIVILQDGGAAIAGPDGTWIGVTLPGQGARGTSDAPLVFDPRTSMVVDSDGDGQFDDISCNAGFQRSGFICVDVNECATRNGDCDPATACVNTLGSFSCGACPPGYTGSGALGCVDINECATSSGGCDRATSCTNTPGGFKCSACPAGYTGEALTGCVDVDECAVNRGGCHPLTICTNTPGGRECGNCPAGYNKTSNGSCVDVDECAIDNGGCDLLVLCANAPGAHTCGDCPPGYTGGGVSGCSETDECAMDNGGCDALTTCTNVAGSFACGVCPAGYTGDGASGCLDVDECATNNGGCDPLSACTNAKGTFTCGLCPAGYSGSGSTGCLDVDECASNNGGCDPLVTCDNGPGRFACGECPQGHSGGGATGCFDVDECAQGTDNCDPLTTCSNTAGGFACGSCPSGYSKDSSGACIDIDECALGTAGCDQLVTCTNEPGSFTCGGCPSGYSGGGATGCIDIDECVVDHGGCDPLAVCTNVVGGAACGACPPGYAGDGRSGCFDIDECATARGGCDSRVLCTNTPGGHACGFCPSGYLGTGSTGCVDVDECATDNGGCDALVTCSNLEGAFGCGGCPTGYTGGGATGCLDIDECATDNGGCDALTVCSNTGGGRECGACPAGYLGTGASGCTDINECGSGNGGCDVRTSCSNTPGSFTCGMCPPGYAGSGSTGCADIDECATDHGGCDLMTSCTNLEGSHSCGACPQGYSKDAGGRCIDVDECATANGGCDAFATCVNEPGTVRCEEPFEDLDGLLFAPHFEPDYNTLRPQPWVELATTRQTETVLVTPEQLIFPLADNPEVLDWAPGRIVVAGPSDGDGSNPLGFARRVSTVVVQGNYIVVSTETVGLQDIVTGDLQHTFDYSQLKDVDLSKLDLDWAAENLYVDADVLSPDFEVAPDDEPMLELDENGNTIPASPFFGKIISAVKKGVTAVGKAVGGAASAVASVAGNVWRAVTPASFTGSVSISREIGANYSSDLFRLNYSKSFNEAGRTPMQLSLTGSGSVSVDVSFKPGLQVGMRIPNIGHNETLATWMNVDSQYRSSIALGVDLEAAITSAGTLSGSDLGMKLAEQGELAADVLTQAREKFTGNPDMKPAGGWKRTIFISSPATQVIFAGPLPVVFTQTFQVDMECGFAAKASLKAQMQFERNSNLKFSMRYEAGRVTGTPPRVETRKNRTVNITGGGSISVSCGLIPRVNVFVYDTAGMFAGVRGSLVAEAGYKSMCLPDPLLSTPTAEVNVGLYGNVGVQVGGRLQAPGSSYAGKAGQKAGTDIGPFELWNTQFPIYEKVWSFDKGLGYCTPTCKNAGRDGRETDVDCGGGSCNACAESRQCMKNSDCARGYCSGGRCSNTNHCGDGVMDGDETGIDCGGASCRSCRVGVGCYLPRDCSSGACALQPVAGSRLGYCVQNHCADLAVSADESGIDCGGSTCAKCAIGVRSSSPAGCVSGVFDGEFCVAATCRDRALTSGETDIDCGGSSSCARCGSGQVCNTNGDCSSAAPICDASTKLCARPMCEDGIRNVDETDVDCGGSCSGRCAVGEGCLQTSDCEQALNCHATQQICVVPRCDDGWKNGTESAIDCGGSCAAKCQQGQACQLNSDCDAAAPNCDSTTFTCSPFTCGSGQYAVGQSCVDVGVGFWSPANDRQRYVCTNLPANASYTSPTASAAQCPFSCNAGYVLDGSGQCAVSATARYLTCASNEVAVGVSGRSGAWFDALGVRCSPFAAGQRSGVVQSGPQVGGTGGVPFIADCGANEVLQGVSGINGWNPSPSWCNGNNLSTVALSCRDLSTSVVRMLPPTGGNGSCASPRSTYAFSCPQGQSASGLVVDSANTTTYVGHMLGTSCR